MPNYVSSFGLLGDGGGAHQFVVDSPLEDIMHIFFDARCGREVTYRPFFFGGSSGLRS